MEKGHKPVIFCGGTICPSPLQVAMSRDIFGCHTLVGVLLGLSVWSPGMLLSTLNVQDRPPSTPMECSLVPNVNSAVVQYPVLG